MTGAAAVLALLLGAMPQDTVRLGDLYAAARETDPRAAQLALQVRGHELRLQTLSTRRLPQFQLRAEATHQSDAPRLPLSLPGMVVEEPPLTRFSGSVVADQLVYDGGLVRAQRSVELARHAELVAELDAVLHPLRVEVTEAFFAALQLQAREAEVRLLISDLASRQAQLRSAVRAGTALPGDTAAVEAERLRAEQALDEVASGRAVALAVLSRLAGGRVGEDDVLAMPDLEVAVRRVEAAGGAGAVRLRPEFERLARLEERLRREATVATARARPQVNAFAQAGAGRPGPFQLFSDDVHEFWQVGVRLQWQPWTWGNVARERALLAVQEQVARTESAALAARLEREVQDQLRTMERLERALVLDDRIIALREQVERQARRQFEERTLTATQYLAARNDVHEARLAARRHRVELEHARARYLTTLGAGQP